MALVLEQEIDPGIRLITLNNPDSLNAMSEAMAREFSALVERLRGEREKLRAIVLTGAGRAFSAGGDLDMLEAKTKISPEENRRLMGEFYESFLGMLTLETPLIAAINGAAVGAGLCLATACDIRIAAEGAKLGFTFVKIGLHPGMGATFFLPRVIGAAYASELLLSGRIIAAAEAEQKGLVSQIVREGSVVDAALAVAREIRSNGPLATRQLLTSLRADLSALPGALQREALCQSENYASAEFLEGVRAMKEKRAPRFI